MLVRARVQEFSLKDFDIPEHLALEFEKELEVYITEGEHINYRVLKMWCAKKGVKLIPVDE